MKRANRSKTIGIPTNLASAKTSLHEEKAAKQKADEVQIEEESQKRSEAFTSEQFQKIWDELADNFESQSQHHEALLLREKVEINDKVITVSISNEALEGTFERIRTQVLEKVRNSLKNDYLQLRSQIVELEKKDMLYTDREKFEHLKKKYPALKDLQDKFGLDPEF